LFLAVEIMFYDFENYFCLKLFFFDVFKIILCSEGKIILKKITKYYVYAFLSEKHFEKQQLPHFRTLSQCSLMI
jgi:hypothetical protein